jgi:hypothetical protein
MDYFTLVSITSSMPRLGQVTVRTWAVLTDVGTDAYLIASSGGGNRRAIGQSV